MAIALTHDITKQDPLSGQQQTLLSDQQRTALRVDLHHDWGNWRAIGNARAARYRDERLNYDELRLNEDLTWRPSYDWQLAAGREPDGVEVSRFGSHHSALRCAG